ncbi:MAG: VCBS repeat-containing protein [Balneolaceae bacterium]
MNSKMKFVLTLSGCMILLVIILLFLRKITAPDEPAEPILTDPVLIEGKMLSEMHCAGCHKYPEPNLLPWETWRFETLDAMAPFLGVNTGDGNISSGLANERSSNPYVPENTYPSEPQVTREEWEKIRNYYLSMAPRQLQPAEKNREIITDSLFFKARYSEHRPEGFPQVTSVKFDPAKKLIYLSDFDSRNFMVFNENLDLVHQSGIESPISHIHIQKVTGSEADRRELLLTFLGRLDPSDAPYGSVVSWWYYSGLQTSGQDSVLLEDITRPVASGTADLNQDGLEDLIVNEFGHRGGSLFWLENKGEGNPPEKKILINTPGCIQSHVMDYTGNSNPDILALCAQTAQAIYLFQNRGDGEFDRTTLLEFNVTAGSSSFEIHDFNRDGKPDILYTSGDNADFSQILKTYHGVYIYLNDGSGSFTKEWFYPVNGAYNAKARDFDGDGNLDLAVISYFADYENSSEDGFIFFKNEGDLDFTPYSHPLGYMGRWMTMDVADWTGNGRDDIILANFPEGPVQPSDHVKEKWKNGPYFLLLENQSGEP